MNGKTAKIIKLYVGLRARAGRHISLKDVKRRYQMLPRGEPRARTKDATAEYINHMAPPDARQLRAHRVKYAEKKVIRQGIVGAIAAILGLQQ